MATQVASREKVESSQRIDIVDADAHVTPPAEMWSDYLPDSLKSLAPKIEHGEDCDYVVFEGNRKKLNLIGSQAGRKGKDFKMHGRVDDARSGGWMPEARLKDMDLDGIDAAVLFGGGPLGTGNMELYIESFRAYNRWLADFCKAAPKRFAGVGYVPMHDVDVAISMIRECVEMGLKAVNLPAFPMIKHAMLNAGREPGKAQMVALTGDPDSESLYSDPEYDRLWKAVCDLGIPITIHLGGRPVRFTQPKHFFPDMLMSKFSMGETIAIMIFGGVFERFPELKLASIESGVGWFAFATNYMDETWEKQRFWMKNDLPHPPSYYMDRNIYGSFIHDRVGVLTRDMPGARNIMWSSDYPHSETSFPDSQKKIEELFEGVSESDRRMILCDRARALFNI